MALLCHVQICLYTYIEVSSKCPTVIVHHTRTSHALVLLYHGGNKLVKLRSMLITHFPKTFWEELSESLRNAPLKTQQPHTFVEFYKIRHHIVIVFCLIISQKFIVLFWRDFHGAFSTSFRWSSDLMSCINFLI